MIFQITAFRENGEAVTTFKVEGVQCPVRIMFVEPVQDNGHAWYGVLIAPLILPDAFDRVPRVETIVEKSK